VQPARLQPTPAGNAQDISTLSCLLLYLSASRRSAAEDGVGAGAGGRAAGRGPGPRGILGAGP